MAGTTDIVQIETTVEGDREVIRRFSDVNDIVRARVREAVYNLGAEGKARAAAFAPQGKTGALKQSMSMFFKDNPSGVYALVYPTARAKSDREKYGFVLSAGVTSRVLTYDMKRRKATVGTRITYSSGGTASVRPTRRRVAVTTQVKRRFVLRPRPYMAQASEGLYRRLVADVEAVLADASREG